MENDNRINHWIKSYQDLAEKIVSAQVAAMRSEFPNERFPVRPPYRKAMYHRLVLIVDELNYKISELLKESPDESDAQLKEKLMSLQEGYEQDFIRQVRKVEER
jgi:hypothetical protein